MEAIKEREREFHNNRFAKETRSAADKYYSVLASSADFYKKLLYSRCPNRRVLEYGCGSGSYSMPLAKSGAKVYGIDLSDVAIQQATERANDEGIRQAVFAVMDAEYLGFPDNSFDLICGRAILHHLKLEQSYAEIARTLNAEGEAIFREPLGHNPLINLYRRLTPAMRTVDEHPFRTSDLDHAAEWFGTVETHYFGMLSLLAVPLRGFGIFQSALRLLDRVDSTLFRAFPFLRRYGWAVVLILSRPKKERISKSSSAPAMAAVGA